jgi:F0F1-type ATP synthase assembly protein I
MVWFVVLQASVGVMAALVALGFGGLQAAGSVLLGSTVVWLPNLMFAVRLASSRDQAAAVWLIGQLAKLGLAVLMLMLTAKFWPTVLWPGLLIGLGLTGLTVFAGPWFVNRAEARAHSKRIDALLSLLEQRDPKV